MPNTNNNTTTKTATPAIIKIKHNALLTLIQHKDVREQTLLYLKIETSKGEILINIGNKTYDKVLALNNE